MDRIDYNQTGGFPLSTQILDAAQKAYKTAQAFGNLAGELAIITGCIDASGGTVTDGFVSVYGELLPFKGTTKTNNVVIVEIPDARGFEDGSVKAVIYTRYVTFGEGTPSYPWADFRRPLTLFQLEDRLKQLEKSVPIGLVAIWGKPASEIPSGWQEYVPMKGRTPVGHLSGDANFGVLDGEIGTSQVTISNANLPPLQASVILAPNQDSAGGNLYGRGGNSGTVTFPVKTGAATPMTNIQPSKIVKFIEFIGLV